MAPISGKRITVSTAMRARDVSRPSREDVESAESVPLRADVPKRPQGVPSDIARSVSRRDQGSGGSSPVAS